MPFSVGADKMATILLIDDSHTLRRDFGWILRENGFTVITANDGFDGLRKLVAHPEVDLIVSDINMPDMDGIQMVERIRNELGNTTIKIIMLTTDSRKPMRDRGKAAGITGWIVKPFDAQTVVKTFQKLIGDYRSFRKKPQ
jgi:two-component system chemotaxis response regulator CheY